VNPDDFRESPSGSLVPSIEGTMAFVPNSLPPPQLDLGGMISPIARATQALGELSGIGRTLPNPYLLLRPFMRREAVASSKIEGTVTTLSELLVYEAGSDAGVSADTIEVRNYMRALQQGIQRLSELPVSTRLMLELHQILMSGVRAGRGDHIVPGEFKRDQNWIGARLIQNARFVPPPPAYMAQAMGDLENYIHSDEEDTVPLVVKLALIHYQFETIHPFPDGNGRIGRLLIPLILAERKQMSHPLLYVSAYLEKYYEKYIDLMFEVSRSGAWETWIRFFLEAVEASCIDAIKKAKAIQDLYSDYRGRIQTTRSSALLAKILDELFTVPATTVPYAQRLLGISYNAAKNNIDRLVECGILTREESDRRPAWFFAQQIMLVSNREEA
jgi:Fic family protein